jgi:RNA polymerase sigma-70 factor (ECF subfamily)
VVIPLPPLEQLYLSHGPAVLRRARQILGNDEEARDVLQDVFTSLLRRPEQFAGRSSPMTFLYSMTTNSALGRLRRRRTRGRLLSTHLGGAEEPAGWGPEALVSLRARLASLPEELARLAVYYHLDELTQDEIANVMGCSRQWVGKLLARLRDAEHGALEP